VWSKRATIKPSETRRVDPLDDWNSRPMGARGTSAQVIAAASEIGVQHLVLEAGMRIARTKVLPMISRFSLWRSGLSVERVRVDGLLMMNSSTITPSRKGDFPSGAWSDPTKSYSDRVAAAESILAGNVFDDGAQDVLNGASGMDLFYISLGDTIHGNTKGQTIVTV
jgi:hypothetical protein